MRCLAAPFEHFEARQVHPVELTPDGRLLLAIDSSAGTLSLFAVEATHPVPIRIAQVPVGLEPTSVRARTPEEAWVVNEVSDSVSVVSLGRAVVIDTLHCPDEPADVVFAGPFACISCARNSRIRVFNAITRAWVADVPLHGVEPRAMAASLDGSRLFVAFAHSGNLTTVLPPDRAPSPPAPQDPSLPAAPQTALIVRAPDSRVPYQVQDLDLAEISIPGLQVHRYQGAIGTLLANVAVHPLSGELWISNTDARNHVRFEPELRGHVADNRITRLLPAAPYPVPLDLNPDIDHSLLPNPFAQEQALAQPTDIVFSRDGSFAWVAASGSDRVARIDTRLGQVTDRVDLRRDPSSVRGPRGLALDERHDRLFVLNKLANTLTVLAASQRTVLAEIPVGTLDPTPAPIREGRGFLFDARLSGNGTASCATCHPDADRDGLAWDLGVPDGSVITVTGANLAAHDVRIRERSMHPMKGPMVTQTLRGLSPTNQFHWRGDRPSLHHFNATFPDLLGGDPIPREAIDSLQGYLLSLRHHPNPNRLLDGALPATFNGGNPTRGKALFDIHVNHCAVCHSGSDGSNNNIDDPRNFGGRQPIKTPPLQTTYQRALLDSRPGATNASGFGLGHDGATGNQHLPTVHFYELDELVGQDFADVSSYVLCFDSGTHPAVGWNRTLAEEHPADPSFLAQLAIVENQASLPNRCSLVVHGLLRGQNCHLLFDPKLQAYVPDSASAPTLSRSELIASRLPGDYLTFLAGLPSQAVRLGIDRNGNGIPDADEPTPSLSFDRSASSLLLTWDRPAPDWVLEQAPDPRGPWMPALPPRIAALTSSNAVVRLTDPSQASACFRLRRTW